MTYNIPFLAFVKFMEGRKHPVKAHKDDDKKAAHFAKLAKCCEIQDEEIIMTYNRRKR